MGILTSHITPGVSPGILPSPRTATTGILTSHITPGVSPGNTTIPPNRGHADTHLPSNPGRQPGDTNLPSNRDHIAPGPAPRSFSRCTLAAHPLPFSLGFGLSSERDLTRRLGVCQRPVDHQDHAAGVRGRGRVGVSRGGRLEISRVERVVFEN